MRKVLLTIAIAILSAAYANAQELNLDAILKNHFETIGQDKLVKTKTMKITGKIVTQGMEFPFTIQVKRPGKMKLEADVQGQKMVQAYNGTTGYMIAPWTGSLEPQDVGEDQLKQFKEQSDIDGKLYDYKSKGSTLELSGTEDMEGTPVYKLKLVEKPQKEGEEGNVSYFYIDTENFVVLKTTTKSKIMGNEVEIEVFSSNYKETEGMMMPFSIEQKASGTTMSQITFEKYTFDEDMQDEIFEKPVKE